MGVTQIDTQKVITEITDELVQKGLTNIKEIRIEPFAMLMSVYHFLKTQLIAKISHQRILS